MASSLVNNKYRITRRIGGGSFGEIYMGIGPNNEKVQISVGLCNRYYFDVFRSRTHRWLLNSSDTEHGARNCATNTKYIVS